MTRTVVDMAKTSKSALNTLLAAGKGVKTVGRAGINAVKAGVEHLRNIKEFIIEEEGEDPIKNNDEQGQIDQIENQQDFNENEEDKF